MRLNNLSYIFIFLIFLVIIVAIIFVPEIFNYSSLSDGILTEIFGAKEKSTLLKVIAFFIEYGFLLIILFVGSALANIVLKNKILIIFLAAFLLFSGLKLYHLVFFFLIQVGNLMIWHHASRPLL